MLELRERILRGENFQRLAQSESDSESRHRQGSIGWVVRGQLPQTFARVCELCAALGKTGSVISLTRVSINPG